MYDTADGFPSSLLKKNRTIIIQSMHVVKGIFEIFFLKIRNFYAEFGCSAREKERKKNEDGDTDPAKQ
jgi:hypothetical protein